MVRKLSSKCAIDTPMIGRAGLLVPPQLGIAANTISSTDVAASRAITFAIYPPLRLHSAMTVPIDHDRRHDNAAFDDVLNVRVEADEREPARHDAQDDRA